MANKVFSIKDFISGIGEAFERAGGTEGLKGCGENFEESLRNKMEEMRKKRFSSSSPESDLTEVIENGVKDTLLWLEKIEDRKDNITVGDAKKLKMITDKIKSLCNYES